MSKARYFWFLFRIYRHKNPIYTALRLAASQAFKRVPF